jgi:hypothetical protein
MYIIKKGSFNFLCDTEIFENHQVLDCIVGSIGKLLMSKVHELGFICVWTHNVKVIVY